MPEVESSHVVRSPRIILDLNSDSLKRSTGVEACRASIRALETQLIENLAGASCLTTDVSSDRGIRCFRPDKIWSVKNQH